MTPRGRRRGGVLLAGHRQSSLVGAVVATPLPPRLVMALDQYDGGAARPVVAVGDRVRRGALIATASGPLGCAVHAPAAAVVAGITAALPTRPDGSGSLAIELVPEPGAPTTAAAASGDYRAQPPAILLDRIRHAGVAGLGGSGFPTARKLDPGRPVATLVLNAVECEPYVTADTALLRDHGREVVLGIDVLVQLLGAPARVVVAVAADNATARAALAAAGAGAPRALDIVPVPGYYPAGSEAVLIELITGHRLGRGQRPAEVGVLCVNVATARAVWRAVALGEPLLSRIVTVAGGACARPGNYEVLIGTPLSHLLAVAGVDAERCPQPLLGGPMMGERVVDTALPLGKIHHCVLAPTAAEMPAAPPPQPCSRCGFCAETCPVGLLPQQLLRLARADDHAGLARQRLDDCIECGACSYVCPSAIPLVPVYREAKARIEAREREQPAADRARTRFEHHQHRFAALLAGRRALRAARGPDSAAAGGAPAAAPVDADATTLNPAGRPPAAPDTAADRVRAAVARAGAADPARERARRLRALAAAEDRLARAEAELGARRGDPPARVLALEARVAAARLHRDEAQRRLAQTDDGGAH